METRNKNLTTKYKCREEVSGGPVPTSSSSNPSKSKKRINPARARRSKLRLEMFVKKKLEEKKKVANTVDQEVDSYATAAGETSSNTTENMYCPNDSGCSGFIRFLNRHFG